VPRNISLTSEKLEYGRRGEEDIRAHVKPTKRPRIATGAFAFQWGSYLWSLGCKASLSSPSGASCCPESRYKECAFLLHEADNRERASPLCTDLTVNLLADFECVRGFFHPADLDHPAIGHKRLAYSTNV